MKKPIIVVGAGLSGATAARYLVDHGRNVTIFERGEVGGHCADEIRDGIMVHKYGIHIWHNSDPEVQYFIERFTEFNNYVHKAKSMYQGKIYSFPINLATFMEVYGCKTPEEAKQYSVDTIKDMLYKNYAIKQWGFMPPQSVFDRLPVRYSFNDRYYDDRWEGIPVYGYSAMIQNMIDDIPIIYDDFNSIRWSTKGHIVLYTGSIDEFHKYKFGKLPYRSLEFKYTTMQIPDYQGVAHMSYADADIPWTKIIEHKHFTNTQTDHTIISTEFPVQWEDGLERFYPLPDRKLYEQYADIDTDMIFMGRLGTYKYWNMNDVVRQALDIAKKIVA